MQSSATIKNKPIITLIPSRVLHMIISHVNIAGISGHHDPQAIKSCFSAGITLLSHNYKYRWRAACEV